VEAMVQAFTEPSPPTFESVQKEAADISNDEFTEVINEFNELRLKEFGRQIAEKQGLPSPSPSLYSFPFIENDLLKISPLVFKAFQRVGIAPRKQVYYATRRWILFAARV